MNLFFLLIFCFFTFLFFTYSLSHDDFVLLRKNVSTEDVFNLSILSLLSGLFLSRLIYIVLNPSINYINPLVFFALPYFPGLSISGGIIGGSLFTIFFSMRKKMPVERLLDISSISFLGTYSIGLFLFLFIEFATNKRFALVGLIDWILLTGFFILLLSLFLKTKLKDGTLSLLILILFSVVLLIQNALLEKNKVFLFFSNESFIWIAILLVSLVLLIKQKRLPFHIKIKFPKR